MPGPGSSEQADFVSWLQFHMRERRLTQRMIAARAGLDHSTISRLLSGDRAPTWATVELLASALGVDPPMRRETSPVTRVVNAITSDPALGAPDRFRLVSLYLAMRTAVPRGAAPWQVGVAGRGRPLGAIELVHAPLAALGGETSSRR